MNQKKKENPSQFQPLQNDEEAPLATSEVSVTAAASRGGASATSSPSLEVQQILHSQNGTVLFIFVTFFLLFFLFIYIFGISWKAWLIVLCSWLMENKMF